MENDSHKQVRKPQVGADQSTPFERIQNDKLTRFLDRMDDELASRSHDITAD